MTPTEPTRAEEPGPPRRRRALLAAVLTAAVGAACLLLYVNRYAQEAAGGELVSVVVATRDLPLGTVLSTEVLGRRDVPSRYVDSRHVRASNVERITGARVSSTVRANEAVLWTDLASSDQRRDLSGLVEEGMRAYSIRTDASSSFGGLLRPGDRVDVILTTDSRSGRAAVPLLQNVLVLAAGADTGGQTSRPQGRFDQVALSVTLDQAQILAVAEEQGRMTLVLRNPDDFEVIEGLPERTAADLAGDHTEAVGAAP